MERRPRYHEVHGDGYLGPERYTRGRWYTRGSVSAGFRAVREYRLPPIVDVAYMSDTFILGAKAY